MNALEQLLTFPRFGAPGVNERMEKMCGGLDMVPTLKVVGSNGKGSTAHMMAQMAQNLGKKVGLYTSPHLLRVGERIRIDGREIQPRDLNYLMRWAIDRAKGLDGVGRFELLTLAAIHHFAQSKVDVAMMEVGLGGRYDPVRIAPGQYSVLTSLDLEHTAILGDTIADIATEKAAVCKPGETLISAVAGIEGCLPEGVALMEVTEPPLSPLQSNARLAAHAVQAHFSLGHLPEISDVRLPGRLHRVASNPHIYIDVAHSPAAVQTVLDQLGGKPVTLIMAARQDKDLDNMPGHFSHVIAVQPEADMYPVEEILTRMAADHKEKANSVEEALMRAKQLVSKDGIILCLGGFSLAGRTLAHLQGIPYEAISL